MLLRYLYKSSIHSKTRLSSTLTLWFPFLLYHSNISVKDPLPPGTVKLSQETENQKRGFSSLILCTEVASRPICTLKNSRANVSVNLVRTSNMYFFVLDEEVSLWKLWQSLRILTVKVLGEKNSPCNKKIREQPWFQNKKKIRKWSLCYVSPPPFPTSFILGFCSIMW